MTAVAGSGLTATNGVLDVSVGTNQIANDAVDGTKLGQFDDTLTAATAGHILVSNGTDFIHTAMGGDATIASEKQKELSQSAFEDKLLGEKYNTAYAAHIIKDFHEHSTKDPFGKWTAYTDYVKPFLQGDPIPGKTLQEQINGIQAYYEAYMYIHGLKEKESLKKAFSNPKVKVLDGFMGKIKANQ